MRCLKNFKTEKEKFEEFPRIKILENPEVYADHNICIVELDDVPDQPYLFIYPGLKFPFVVTLDFLKDYTLKTPKFYLKKSDEPESDSVIETTPELATHILRLPADTKVEDLIIQGENVLKIEKMDGKK